MTLEPEKPQALVICGLLSKESENFITVEADLEKKFGSIALRSELFPFDWTDYYNSEMGEGILRKWAVFSEPRNLLDLWKYKLESGEIEKAYSKQSRRTVNIDPGFIRLDGLWLLTTKPAGHRAYLEKGVWIEMTLRFLREGCEEMAWTYPDHRDPQAQNFFLKAREHLKKDLRDV
jgi:hypothetical protein